MKRPTSTPYLIAGLIFILLLCICLVVFISSALAIVSRNIQSTLDENNSDTNYFTPLPTPLVIRPESFGTPLPPPSDTLTTLEDTIVPGNDPRELARRLEGKMDIPATMPPPSTRLQIGEQKSFWVSNPDTNQHSNIQATLQYITDHLYFWVENGIRFNNNDLRDLADTFEEQIYPTNRDFFGSEWTPGIDGDPHLYILYATDLGNSVAGYFSSADELPPSVHEYSNAHEMFQLNADNIGLDEQFTYGVLAHEFQHMIHWYQDRNEETWLDEGFSELASFLNGYDVGGFDYAYIRNPDLQLTNWPVDGDTGPNYGASFLFVAYFLDRFGEQATKSLIAHSENGIVSVDHVLSEIGAASPDNGQPIGADDFFLDWVIASYLQDSDVEAGQYDYDFYPGAPKPNETEKISRCPTGSQSRSVSQYGVDYIRIDCQGEFVLNLDGSTQVGVLPVDPHSGSHVFWSNRGDESNMSLSRSFDFTDHQAPITLSYWTWYDLEKDYDYLYLIASTDGQSWKILDVPSGITDDPSGNSYGLGYTGFSGDGPHWIEEQVDLSQFAGQSVQVRFEYVTDTSVHGEGFLLDDVSIPEIDYFTGFENDDGGWKADGFARIQNVLPQAFQLALVSHGRPTTVEKFELSPGNQLEIPLNTSASVRGFTLVISGTTRFTRQPAAYRFEILPRQ